MAGGGAGAAARADAADRSTDELSRERPGRHRPGTRRFHEELQKLGWTEGRNIRIDTRWAAPDDAGSMQQFAKELVALQPDLIVFGTTTTTAALLQYTRTISIVFVLISDPVGSGFVASFSRPGGNAMPVNVAAGPIEANDEAGLDRVNSDHENDRNRCGRGLGRERRRHTARRHDERSPPA